MEDFKSEKSKYTGRREAEGTIWRRVGLRWGGADFLGDRASRKVYIQEDESCGEVLLPRE